MRELILNFLNKELPLVSLKSYKESFLPGIFIEKIEEKFILGIQEENLKKLNLNQEELLFFLYHEKGHIELNHFDGKTSIEISVLLLTLFFLLCVLSIAGCLFFSLTIFITYFNLVISSLMAIDILIKLKKARKRELEADRFALNYSNIEVFISLMNKLDKIYKIKKSIFSTHPCPFERIQYAIVLCVT